MLEETLHGMHSSIHITSHLGTAYLTFFKKTSMEHNYEEGTSHL